jgi:hypothetical protein
MENGVAWKMLFHTKLWVATRMSNARLPAVHSVTPVQLAPRDSSEVTEQKNHAFAQAFFFPSLPSELERLVIDGWAAWMVTGVRRVCSTTKQHSRVVKSLSFRNR